MWRALACLLLVLVVADDAFAKARANIQRWRQNPVQFVVEQFGVEPDAWQRDALMAFADPTKPRISMQACAGPGKSAVLAWCGWNFLSCYGDRGEHPKGAAVSVTWDNLRDNLWPEFAVAVPVRGVHVDQGAHLRERFPRDVVSVGALVFQDGVG